MYIYILRRLTYVYRYYVLVAACVFAPKQKWLRHPCLAAALALPAVAAIHSVVLASTHVEGILTNIFSSTLVRANRLFYFIGAVDMDV